MKIIILISIVIFALSTAFSQNYLIINNDDGTEYIHIATGIEDVTFMDLDCGTATVLYSGKTYNTVLIGSSCWLRENLNIGTRIDASSNQSNNATIEKYCYNNLESYCDTDGGLYQWEEALQYVTTEGEQGICPPGWHIPTEAEFLALKSEVGDDGNALKRGDQGGGTNTSGFSALLAGYCNPPNFSSRTISGRFWSSTKNATNPILMGLTFTSAITIGTTPQVIGYSIRCIKD